ncbi:Uncharacterized protein APZ42_015867 [Daphnia magna]|uniref:Uncharacterized protein n=1 Tax=Daphnia magna TaxID=35525 RepID=A0A162NCT1_9CRUS|nr:Uncharacterized protein APZ42_015867 [Daphnia magna]
MTTHFVLFYFVSVCFAPLFVLTLNKFKGHCLADEPLATTSTKRYLRHLECRILASEQAHLYVAFTDTFLFPRFQ